MPRRTLERELIRTEESVARARADVALSLAALRQELRRRLDWHAWVARNRVVVLGLAFGLGFYIGSRR
ncbi:hypothetical protein HY251_00855 [bacterium]|nr:hypothetical protein [bacterium]